MHTDVLINSILVEDDPSFHFAMKTKKTGFLHEKNIKSTTKNLNILGNVSFLCLIVLFDHSVLRLEMGPDPTQPVLTFDPQ